MESISVPMSVEFDEINKMRENPEEAAAPLIEFTDEEGYGKFLDLHEHYQKYLNLKGVEVSLYTTLIEVNCMLNGELHKSSSAHVRIHNTIRVAYTIVQ